MILQTENFKQVCSTVLAAADGSELSALTETVELKANGNVLYLNVTNTEYYATVKFPLDHEETDFHAAVNANLFLKLIAATTTETIELNVRDTYLEVKANGNYKLPFIFEGDEMIEVPKITIENPTVQMTIDGSILDSILKYNAKQLNIGTVATAVQKMFYIDEEGCITFTSGACVNKFELAEPVKVILNSRLVNLFRLFKGSPVSFTLGYDPISETLISTKVSFENACIKISAVTACNDALLKQVPVGVIRERAYKAYDNSVVFSTLALTEAVNRLLLFSAGYGTKETLKPYSFFEFEDGKVIIYDNARENHEELIFQNGSCLPEPYSMRLDITQLKKVLETCSEEYITMSFGDHKACVITRGDVKNVLQEVRPH